MTIDERFSRDLKMQKLLYLEDGAHDEKQIRDQLNSLEAVDLSELDTNDKKRAFWINVYNGLTNWWIIRFGIKKRMREKPDIFFDPKRCIGGLKWSLDDIEHGILRKNARVKHKLFFHQFTGQPHKRRLMVEQADPRIHFALNCGARSCPPIAFYTAEHVQSQLQLAQDHFVKDGFVVDHQDKTITCSAIFVWYKRDFVTTFLNDPALSDYKVRKLPYDWRI